MEHVDEEFDKHTFNKCVKGKFGTDIPKQAVLGTYLASLNKGTVISFKDKKSKALVDVKRNGYNNYDVSVTMKNRPISYITVSIMGLAQLLLEAYTINFMSIKSYIREERA